MPSLHEDFHEVNILDHSLMPTKPLSAQDLKNRLADTRAKAVKVILNYEESCNSERNQAVSYTNGDDDEDDNIMMYQNDDWANFLLNYKSHILYFWELMNQNVILNHVLAVLLNAVSASSESVPGSQDGNKRQKSADTKNAEAYTMNNISMSLNGISLSGLHQQSISSVPSQLAENRNAELQLMMTIVDKPMLTNFCNKQLKKFKEALEALESQLNGD